MNDAREVVTHLLAQLAGPSADDACHALLELGRLALPQLVEAVRGAKSREVKLRLAQIITHIRAAEAESFLVELLEITRVTATAVVARRVANGQTDGVAVLPSQ